MIRKNNCKVICVLAFIGMLTGTFALAKNVAEQSVEPDYTHGEKLLLKPHVWSIGPTGVSGTIWYRPNSTADARMMQITKIARESPADGILQKGDVILGVGNAKFQSDPRKAMAASITESEMNKYEGRLTLNIWRPIDGQKGKSMAVTIVLPVMGEYSLTSPWQCEKSEALIRRACETIAKRGLFKKTLKGDVIRKAGVNGTVDALGLLATGDKQYLPIIKDYIKAITTQVSSPEDLAGLKSWPLAYMNILLCEYYLLTEDKDVLSSIRVISSRIVEGRSGVGTWGHSMRMQGQNFASGYGSMNQVGLTLTISLILAQKCDVNVPDLDVTLKQSLSFFRYFVEKGSIPYGDHSPGAGGLAGNGKSAQAAVMFDLAGDKASAEYFTRLAIASYNQLEEGHTGHFFNGLWGALGAARGGASAAQSYSMNVRWFTEAERCFDGAFIYQPGFSSAEHGKYSSWSTSGSRLLQYCLPRNKLYITGKGGSCVSPIEGDVMQRVAYVGDLLQALSIQPAKYTTEELLGFLGSWSPAVRESAAMCIGQREEDVVDRLIAMLESDDRFMRYGACEGLTFAGRGSEKAVDALVKRVLEPGDMNLRFFAVKALRIPCGKRGEEKQYRNALGTASLKAGPALLSLVACRRQGDDSNDALFGMIAETLFYGGSAHSYRGHYPGGEGLDDIDRKLLISSVKALLANRNGRARGMVSSIYPKLTEAELSELWPDIYRATRDQAPSGVMFSAEVRGLGLDLLAEKGYVEGIELAMRAFRQEGWGHHKRNPAAFDALAQYGAHIKPYLPELQSYFEKEIAGEKKNIAAQPDSKFVGKKTSRVRELEQEWQQLQDAAKNQRELRSISHYLSPADAHKTKE